MRQKPIAAVCSSILVALAACAGLVANTHAAVYTGTFDPEDVNYRWSGTHLFNVDDACLSSNGWQAANDGYTACTAELTGGSLRLLDKYTGIEETVDLSGFTGTASQIWGVYVVNNQLAGVDSDLIGQILFSQAPLDGFEWWLRWESGKAPTSAIADNQDAGFYGYSYAQNLVDPVYLSRCTDSGCQLATAEPARTVTFTPVPEPGSLALVGAALGLAALSRRRRHA